MNVRENEVVKVGKFSQREERKVITSMKWVKENWSWEFIVYSSSVSPLYSIMIKIMEIQHFKGSATLGSFHSNIAIIIIDTVKRLKCVYVNTFNKPISS